jgi:hypothetical protein
LSFSEKFIALLHYLMCSADEIDIVLFQEVGDDISAEDETDSSLVLCPS